MLQGIPGTAGKDPAAGRRFYSETGILFQHMGNYGKIRRAATASGPDVGGGSAGCDGVARAAAGNMSSLAEVTRGCEV